MVRWFLFTIILHISLLANTQNVAIAHFNKTIHSFNVIKEVDGKVNYDFVFINKGKIPVIIKQVKSTCGCMSPNWTKAPVLPGKTGFIKATFDPENRPGNFDKTITVFTNAKKAVHLLRIRGKVIPKKKTILDNYPYELPSGLRMTFDHIAFRTIKEGSSKKIEIPVLNNHGKDLKIQFTNIPPHIKLKILPEVLPHRSKGKIIAEYYSKDINALGFLKDVVKYMANGHKESMFVSANIKQDYSHLSPEQKALAPSIRVGKRLIRFGELATGKDIVFTIDISNKGKSTLKLKKIYAYNTELQYSPGIKDLKPGESQIFTIKVRTKNLEGKQKLILGIISNDPLYSEIKIRLSGNLH